MDARIVIDLRTATPPFEQIQGQIVSLIAVGELPAGTRLPTVRSLAADLGVAAGTVARAYKELEASGVVTTNRRQGTVVLPPTFAKHQDNAGLPAGSHGRGGPAASLRTAGVPMELMAAVDHYIAAGERAGLDGKALVSLLQGRLSQGASRSDPPVSGAP